jgi:anti-anti-sigma factor
LPTESLLESIAFSFSGLLSAHLVSLAVPTHWTKARERVFKRLKKGYGFRKIMGKEKEVVSLMEQEVRRGVSIIRLAGDITLETYRTQRDAMLKALEESGGRLLVDLENVRMITSLGWGLLLAVLRRANESHAQFKLMNLPDYLVGVFLLLRLERVFELFDDEELALRSFGTAFHLEDLV